MRRVGVYVDSSNVTMCGGAGLRYDVLRKLACRGGGEAQRLNTYLAYDERRAEGDFAYKDRSKRFQSILRDQGFRITVKKVKHFRDDEGVETKKSNADLDMAVDALTESERLPCFLSPEMATSCRSFARFRARAVGSKCWDSTTSRANSGTPQISTSMAS